MPTYIYKNLTTGEVFEVQQRMVEDALTHHPETGDPVKKLVSAPAIAFKGSGFYANDSRASKSSGSGNAKTEDSSGQSEGKPESGSSDSTSSNTTASSAAVSSTPSSGNAASSAPAAPASTPSSSTAPVSSSKTG